MASGPNAVHDNNDAMARAEKMRLKRDPVSPYREECKWWAAHLIRMMSYGGDTAKAWLDTVEGWVEIVAPMGYSDAIDELSRLNNERRTAWVVS